MTPKTKATKATPGTKPGAVERAEERARNAAKADQDAAVLKARFLTDGSCNAAVVQQYLSNASEGGDAVALVDTGAEQAKAIGSGDLSQLESMLLTQATALQAMFVDLAVRAKMQGRFDGIQTMTTLALKCATGSRQAITALAELRMPKTVMFAKQANVTSGPQQVNNGVVAAALPARAEEIQSRPNELLEAQHGNHLDTRAQSAAGGADPHLVPVEEIHRTDVTGRKSGVGEQCLQGRLRR